MPAWTRFFASDFFSETSTLNTVQTGAYALLCAHYRAKGSLPVDDNKLRQITKLSPKDWPACRDAIADLFTDGWRHEKIDEELSLARGAYERRSAAGRKGAQATWGEASRPAAA
jgi:uncharacterized protein YdaU (DUF1376 family)